MFAATTHTVVFGLVAVALTTVVLGETAATLNGTSSVGLVYSEDKTTGTGPGTAGMFTDTVNGNVYENVPPGHPEHPGIDAQNRNTKADALITY